MVAPPDWKERVVAMFGQHFWHPFSEPHRELWDWAEAIDPDTSPRPFVAIWPRGRGKSTNAEAIAADLGARRQRSYCMYVCGTQDQADKHVGTVARMLESDSVARYFPEVGQPKVGKNGNRQWNRKIVTTASGYTIEAVGLNKAVRGQKIDWARPDLIVLDDIDEEHDSELVIKKKIQTMTGSVFPAGASNVAILFVQNLIHSASIASMLAKPPYETGAAEFLMNRIISGPFPAVYDLEYEKQIDDGLVQWKITGGFSEWEGFGLDVCEAELNRDGPRSFLTESQHEVDTENPNALWTYDTIDTFRVTPVSVPDLKRIVVGVDPPGGATECGIVVAGLARNGHGYVLFDGSLQASPGVWGQTVVDLYNNWEADRVAGEANFGGDMVENTVRTAVGGQKVAYTAVRASRGKEVRAEPIASLYERGLVHHAGTFSRLEKEMVQWEPGDSKSPNRMDALVWALTELMVGPQYGPPKVTRYA